MPLQIRGRVFRNESAMLAARLEDKPAGFASAGTPFLQANFSSIVYSVIDTTNGQPVSSNGTTYSNLPLTVSSVIYDVLQNWPQDSRGYNFLLTLSPSAIPLASHQYQVEVRFVLTDGRQGYAVFDLTTDQTWS